MVWRYFVKEFKAALRLYFTPLIWLAKLIRKLSPRP